MKRIPFLTVAAVAATILFASCNKGGKSDLHIPKDAMMVFYVKTSSLTSKLSWDEIKSSEWFKESYNETSDSMQKKIMENPEASGVDMKSDFAMYMKKQGKSGLAVVEGKIKNAKDFETFLVKQNESAKIEKSGDLQYVSNEDNLISWNDDHFMFMSNADMPDQSMMMPGSDEGSYNDYQDRESRKFGKDSLLAFTKALLDLDGDEKLNDDDRFSSMLKESGDVHLWMNSEEYMGSLSGMLSMFKFGDLLKDNVSTMSLNFEDGQITMKSKQFYGEEMSKLMESYKSKTVDAALVNRIPSQDVVAALVMNYDPAWLKEFFKKMGLDGVINGYLGRIGYSLDELIGATGGQFLASVSDFKLVMKEVTMPAFYEGAEPYTVTRQEPEMRVVVAASVNNKASFDKLIDIAKKNMEGADTAIAYKTTNEWFVAGNHMETVDKFLAGGNNKLPFADKISGHPFGMYVDLQRILKGIPSKNKYDSSFMNIALQTWQDVVGTGGEFKDGVMTGEFVINMVDKKTNSLKQLNQFAEKVHAASKERRRTMEEEYDLAPADSIAAPRVEAAPSAEAPKEQRD